MSSKITICDDQTVTITWQGKRGEGSLFQLAAEGNAAKLNLLDEIEILTVLVCARKFPYADRRRVYMTILGAIRKNPDALFPDGHPKVTLGELRKAVIVHIGDQFGDSTSEYLDFAVDSKQQAAA